MSSQRVGLLERAYAARPAEAEDETLAAFLHPDFVLDMSRREIESEVYEGFSGLRRFYAAIDEGWENFEAHPQRYIESGDRVVVFATMSARGRESGLKMEVEIAHVWTFRGDKLARMEYFGDREEALRAVGVEPEG